MNLRNSFNPDLEYLLLPIEVKEFFARYWETRPLIINRKTPDYYASLLQTSDLDFIISGACAFRNQSVDLISRPVTGAESKSQQADNVETIYQAYRQGSTIRVRHAERHWKALHSLCGQLEQLFNFPVKANLYCTPGEEQGLARHWDTHDVLVLQVSGSKRWLVSEPVVSLPLENLPPLSFEERTEKHKYYRGGPNAQLSETDPGEGDRPQEFVLESGDLLYLPRGFVHEACSLSEASVHLTLGIHVLTWLDLLAVALGQTANRDERLRKALPVGFANRMATSEDQQNWFYELLRGFSEGAHLNSAFEEIAGSFFESRQATRGGSLVNSDDLNSIHVDSFVQRSPGFLCRLVVAEDTVALASARNVVSLPKIFEPALRFIIETPRFRVSEIACRMSDRSKVSLVRSLVKDEFLSIAHE